MKVRVAHLSDPHFGTVKPEIKQALLNAMKDLNPSLIVISGDISQRATYSQFREARAFTKSLAGLPLIAIPGNHDIPLFNLIARLFYPYAGFRSVFKGILQRRLMVNGVQVLALNSTSRFRHIQGDLVISKLKKHLSEMSNEALIRIVTFHHPMACPKHVDVKNLLKGREQVMKILEEKKIDLILGGHIHDPHVALSTEHYKDVKRAAIFSVAGTCLSWRTRADAPNSFHLIDIETENSSRLEIIRYDVDQNFRFQPVGSQKFTKDTEAGWQRA
ncbi:MAG: metallophosphoesterase [Bdellovibrio sp.]|nr:metallophosphoesterase [Bdellovibrio sp.]